MKLFVTKPYAWGYDREEIIHWTDFILTDAINTSPYTISVQSRNTTLFAYEAALRQNLQFGAESSSKKVVVMNPAGISPPVDIRRNIQSRAVDKI